MARQQSLLVLVLMVWVGFSLPDGFCEEDGKAKVGSEVMWERDIPAALDKAQREKKLILAAVKMQKVKGKKGEMPKAQGMVFRFMLASLFTGTEIVDLVNRRFVPLQVSYSLIDRTSAIHHQGRPAGRFRDPLELLGTDIVRVKPQALLLVSPEGNLLGMLNGMAAYDPGMVYRFLLDTVAKCPFSKSTGTTLLDHLRNGELEAAEKAVQALPEGEERTYRRAQIEALRGNHEKAARAVGSLAGSSKWAGLGLALKGISLMRSGELERSIKVLQAAARKRHGRVPEALYWLGCVQERQGRGEKAAAIWRELISKFPDSPFAWKSQLRLRNEPPYFDEYEAIVSFAVPGNANGTEYAVDRKKLHSFVGYPIDFLLRQQQPNGFWRAQEGQAEKFGGFGYKAAITSLSLMALMHWERKVEGKRKAAVREALKKGTKAILDSMDMIGETSITLDFTYTLWALLMRFEKTKSAKLRPHVQKAVDGLSKAQYLDGGWGYCNRSTSFNTGPALFLLAKAKTAGFRVDPTVLEKGIRILLQMRAPDGVYHYCLKKGFHWMSKPSMTTGRSPICETALHLHGKADKEGVARTIEAFLKYEDVLRSPVKVFHNCCNPKGHAGYHYLFAYHNVVTAVGALGEEGKKYRDKLYGGILSYVELDNTWVDNHTYGKVYGTAMALTILGELEDGQ
ncbi:MAG: tetratricopeptide repeat protein [Planctomycetota bacterium]|jgi:tetratricopeptide (TPR) repeat protein